MVSTGVVRELISFREENFEQVEQEGVLHYGASMAICVTEKQLQLCNETVSVRTGWLKNRH